MFKNIISGLIFLISFSMYGQQPSKEKMSDAFLKEGFENIRITLEENIMIICFENTIYRNDLTAISTAIKLIPDTISELESIILISTIRKIPIVQVIISMRDYWQYKNQLISQDEFVKTLDISTDFDHNWSVIKHADIVNNSLGKINMIVHPELKAAFGQYSNPIRIQLGIAPELNTSLWPGFNLSSQIILPIYNELEGEGNRIRPGLLTISQFFRLNHSIFFMFTYGYYPNQHRFGPKLEVKKLILNGKFSLGAMLDYTGYAGWNYEDQFLDYYDFDRLTSSVYLDYRWAKYDLTMKCSYGQYLYKDRGVRFDVNRQFGEKELGFFILRTDLGTNAGFNFSFPIFPKSYYKSKRFLIRPSRYFATEYRVKAWPFVGGTGIKNGNQLDDLLHYYNPDYIRKFLYLEFQE